MGNVDDRYEQFRSYLHSGTGGGVPDPFDGLDDAERIELTERLETLADSWLNAPTDPALINQAAASDPRLERIRRSVEGESGVWPSMLPRLREREGIDRDELARRLADDLGGADAEKVRRYYHSMEWGRLPAQGVSGAVLDSLGRLLDVDADELRESGTNPPRGRRKSPEGARTSKTFARFVGGNVTPGPAEAGEDFPPEGDWDETDRLFLGG